MLGVDDVNASSTEWVAHSFPWSYGGQSSVVADYDVAVVNLLDGGLQELGLRGLSPDIDGDVVLDLLRAVGRLVFSGGEVVVLGHPDFHVKAHGLPGRGTYWSTLPYWTGMDLQWDERAGDQIEILVREGQPEPGRFGRPPRPIRSAGPDPAVRFLPYLRELRRYDYSLLNARASKEAEHLAGPPPGPIERALRSDTRYLAQNRHGGGVATDHLLEVATRAVDRRNDGWVVRATGRVVLLPGIAMSPRETVVFLLREAYGVHVPQKAPPWLAEIKAPGEAPLAANLQAAQAALDAASSQVAATEAERNQARDVLKILTARDDELEERVRDVLRRLGAHVEEPVETNKEDGWIHVDVPGQVLEGVLEIKSTQNETFDEGGLRQLMEWVARTQRARGRLYKGIFVGNSAYARPPSERGDPFSSSFRMSAEANGFAAVTAATLLRQLRRVVDDGADSAAFWKALFGTRGVFE